MTAPNDLFGLLTELYVTMGGSTTPTPNDLLSFLALLNTQLATIVAATGTANVANSVTFTSRTLTTTGAIANTDYYIFSNPSTAATYTLPAVPALNQVVVVKDIAGTAAARNVTIAPNSGSIDGQANVALSSNYASTDLVWNGSAWNVIVPAVANSVAFTARTLTSTGPIANTDYYIFSNQSTAATYTLPAVPALNQIVVVKDIAGTASTRNITIAPNSGTIDGQASVALTTNYASTDLVWNGSAWNVITGNSVVTIVGSSLYFTNIAAMTAYNVSAFVGGTTYTAFVAGYNTAGDGGGGTFVYKPSDLTPTNGVVHFGATGGAGRWVRQLANNILTLEMAGGAGDYLFPGVAWAASTAYGGTTRIQNGANIYYATTGGTSASSGGPTGTGTAITDGTCVWQYLGVANTGTDNRGAFSLISPFLGFNSITGFVGGTVSLGAGKYYLISTDCSVVAGTKIVGEGWRSPLGLTSNNGIFSQLGLIGSVLVIDPTIMFNLETGCKLDNVSVIRRNMNLNPTTAQVIAFTNSLANELSPSMVWLPNTAYALNAIVVNIQGVYKCDTAGTSGSYTAGGPTGVLTTTNAIIDGTARWHFINQLQWTGGTAFLAGTVVTSFDTNTRHLNSYLCDTAGTSAAAQYGPSGTTATVNSITDGTAKWHYIGKVSVGITLAQQLNSMNSVTVVGFAVGIMAPQGVTILRDCYMDNLINLDLSGTGDTNIIDHIHCIGIYLPSADSPSDTTYLRKPATCFHFHDHVEETIITDCESIGWSVGMRFSNVWGPTIARAHLESAPMNVVSDCCIQLRNVCSYLEFDEVYAGGMIAFDISATDTAHAVTSYTGITIGSSSVLIRGGQTSVPTSIGKHFVISGNANGSISDMNINCQGSPLFTFAAANGGPVCWTITDTRIDEATTHPTFSYLMSTIDSTMQPSVHFSNIWDANQNRWAVPPGYDDSVDTFAPTTGGSHTIADSTGWCYLSHGSTIATYTLTMPANPLGNGEVTITAKSAVTALTVSPNSGQSIDLAPTTIAAHGALRFKYLFASTTWVRMIMA